MPKYSKTSPDNTSASKTSTVGRTGSKSATRTKISGGKRITTFFVSAIVVLILVIIFVSLYTNAAPFRAIVITVDDVTINMDYFLRRMKHTGANSQVMLEALTNEQLIKIEAPGYGVKISPEDIDAELRNIAAGQSGTITESEFETWYRQLRNDFDFSDREYREIVATSLLASGLRAQLAARVPKVAEQIYVHLAVLDQAEVSRLVQAEQAGDELDALTEEMWLVKESEEEIEDAGWMPRGLVSDRFDEAAFRLPIDEVGGPVAWVNDRSTDSLDVRYFLIKVLEKSDSREITDALLQALQAKALQTWLLNEIELHNVEWHGLNNGFDSETNAWINWQLSRRD